MATNSFSGLVLPLLATQVATYLHARSAVLSRCRIETTQQVDAARGGYTINIPSPMAEMDPVVYSYPNPLATPPTVPGYTDLQAVNIPTIQLTFNNHLRTRISANQLESRIAAGNFDNILALAQPGIMEGMTRTIDKSLIALYTGLSTTPVGTPGVPLSDYTIRNGISTLSANMVDPSNGDVHFVLGDQVYWLQLPQVVDSNGNRIYTPAYAMGDNKFIREGDVGQLYGLRVNHSQNIGPSQTSPVSTPNLMFQTDAFTIGFLEMEPANKYAKSAPVDEYIYVDPNTGVSVRSQLAYDVGLQAWTYSVDAVFGVAVYMPNRGVVVYT
jgi:hypothetical protein